MPNQLRTGKRRQSFIDEEALLDALAEVAKRESRPVASLIRDALRRYLSTRSESEEVAQVVRKVVREKKPKMPAVLKTASSVSKFKAARRDYDALVLALGVESPEEVQARNSVFAPRSTVRVINFATAHTAR